MNWKAVKCPACQETIADTTCFRCDRELRVGVHCEHPRMLVAPGNDGGECIHLVTCSDFCFAETHEWHLEMLNQHPKVKRIKETLLPNGHGSIALELWDLN